MAITCSPLGGREVAEGQEATRSLDGVKGKEDWDYCGLNGGCKGYILKDGLKALTSVGRGGTKTGVIGRVGSTYLSELLVGIWAETIVGCIVVVWRECLEETQEQEPTCSWQKILKPQDFLRAYIMRHQGLRPAHHSLSQQGLPPS